MAFGIHKPGQGYWVRVISAAVAGVMIFATAAWLWEQGKVLAERLPRTSWAYSVSHPSGSIKAGDTVHLTAGTEQLGDATVVSYDPTQELLVISKPVMAIESADPSSATRLTADGGYTAGVLRTESSGPIQAIYLQGAFAAAVVVIGALLSYWLIGVKKESADFLIATDGEMKKVHWSTRKDILGSTWVVIGATFFLSAMLFIFDLVLQSFFKAIGVLLG